jgi:hypothetical protein
MNDLVKYDAACRAVAEAVSIDEAKAFRDKGDAMRAYARQAKNKQLEVQAAEIRIRAERRIGELMAAQREAGLMATGGQPHQATGLQKNPVAAPPTLAEVGIDKNLADRARKYAAIPEKEFNGIVDEWKGRVEAESARVTVDLLAAGKKAEAKKAKDAPAAADAEPEDLPPDPYGYANLTERALLETANGLRATLDEERAKRKKAEGDAAALKQKLADHTADDKDEVIRRINAELKNMRNQRFKAEEKFAAEQRKTYALKKEMQSITNQVIDL